MDQVQPFLAGDGQHALDVFPHDLLIFIMEVGPEEHPVRRPHGLGDLGDDEAAQAPAIDVAPAALIEQPDQLHRARHVALLEQPRSAKADDGQLVVGAG